MGLDGASLGPLTAESRAESLDAASCGVLDGASLHSRLPALAACELPCAAVR